MLQSRTLQLSIVALVLLIACSKDTDVSESPGDGFWILYTQRYNIKAIERSSTNQYFILTGKDSATSTNVLQLYFQHVPAVSGTYKVVPFESNVPLNTGEVGIKVRIPNTGSFSSTGIRDNRTWLPCSDAEVTVNSGKISVAIPQMTTIIVTSTYLDTASFEGVLIEK
jgi:hypothetical protein